MNIPTTGIRASDAEREQIAKLLQTAAGEGRLTPEEAGDRLARASTARYRDELEDLLVDLPPVIRETPRGRSAPRAFWIVGGLLRAATFAGLLAFFFWGVGLWPMWINGMLGFFAITRALRFGWYARRRWWMMPHGSPRRWATIIR